MRFCIPKRLDGVVFVIDTTWSPSPSLKRGFGSRINESRLEDSDSDDEDWDYSPEWRMVCFLYANRDKTQDSRWYFELSNTYPSENASDQNHQPAQRSDATSLLILKTLDLLACQCSKALRTSSRCYSTLLMSKFEHVWKGYTVYCWHDWLMICFRDALCSWFPLA